MQVIAKLCLQWPMMQPDQEIQKRSTRICESGKVGGGKTGIFAPKLFFSDLKKNQYNTSKNVNERGGGGEGPCQLLP